METTKQPLCCLCKSTFNLTSHEPFSYSCCLNTCCKACILESCPFCQQLVKPKVNFYYRSFFEDHIVVKCPRHPAQNIEAYCPKDLEYLCRYCVQERHNEHSCVKIEKSSFTTKFVEISKKLNKKRTDIDKV